MTKSLNIHEADEISDEDLDATADMYDHVVLKAKQKQEALVRMEIIGIRQPLIDIFKEDDIPYCSLSSEQAFGVLDDEATSCLQIFEQEHNALVYHSVITLTSIGLHIAMFYVSENQEEWEDDRTILKEGLTYAYIENMDDKMCSEIGSIEFKIENGIINRIA